MGDTSATEIAEIEQSLIKEGVSPEEIKKFCTVHALLFQSALKKSVSEETFPAHPVYLFKLENREIEKLIESIRELLSLQPCQPFLRTLNLRDTGDSVLPEVEEFLIMLYGFALRVYLILFSITYFTYLIGPR